MKAAIIFSKRKDASMLILKNAKVYRDGNAQLGNVIIEKGKIAKIREGSFEQLKPLPTSDKSDVRIVDCKEQLLLPGFIDAHVHLRDLEQSYKETIVTGTKGALRGGTTTVLTMPNTKPPLTNSQMLKKYKENIEESDIEPYRNNLFTNVGVFCSIKDDFTPESLSEPEMKKVFGLKVYPKDGSQNLQLEWDSSWRSDLGASEFSWFLSQKESDEEYKQDLKDSHSNWMKLFAIAKKHDLPILIHPELITSSESITQQQVRTEMELRKKGNQNPNLILHNFHHPIEQNERALVEMIVTLLRLAVADPFQAPHIHFCHISSPECLIVIQSELKDHKFSCSVESTPHHMLLNHQSNFHPESYGKVLVPLRSPKIQSQLREILGEKNLIDIIATDHAPHTIQEKTQGGFSQAPSGLPYIDFAPRLMLSEVLRGKLALKVLIEKYCEKPAEIFGLKTKGKIAKGYDADLCLIENVKDYIIRAEEIWSKQKWTPFQGRSLCARISKVIVGGIVVYDSKSNQVKANGAFISP